MENIILIIHMILALCLIGIVLLQRSEGGGLGIGGGGGAISGRSAATALGKLTWLFAVAFIATSIILTALAASNANRDSVIERLGSTAETSSEAPALTPSLQGDLTPPAATDEPVTPPAPTE